MKHKSKLFPLLVSVTLVVGLFSSGCSTTPAGKVTQADNVTVTTVDAAMGIWQKWVLAGNATQAQVDLIKGYYNVYYNAQLQVQTYLTQWVTDDKAGNTVASSVDQANVVKATAAVTYAQSNLISVVTTLTKGN